MIKPQNEKKYFRIIMVALFINAVLMLLIIGGFSQMDESHKLINMRIDSVKLGYFFFNQPKIKTQ